MLGTLYKVTTVDYYKWLINSICYIKTFKPKKGITKTIPTPPIEKMEIMVYTETIYNGLPLEERAIITSVIRFYPLGSMAI